jgi:NAD(P)-dependent dehydrogenase (short-subunit alcohol dehydrogenase family)
MQTENWDRVMNTLLRSVMSGIKHSIKPMKLRGGGAIVNTSSISGVTTAGPVGYCVAKAAVIQLTRVAAIELGRRKIRVNALLPRCRSRAESRFPSRSIAGYSRVWCLAAWRSKNACISPFCSSPMNRILPLIRSTLRAWARSRSVVNSIESFASPSTS